MLSLWHHGRDSILAKSVLSSLKRGALSCSCVAHRRLRTALLLPPLACGATRAFSRMLRVCAQLPLVAWLPYGSLYAMQHPNALLLCQTLHVGLYMFMLDQALHVGLYMPKMRQVSFCQLTVPPCTVFACQGPHAHHIAMPHTIRGWQNMPSCSPPLIIVVCLFYLKSSGFSVHPEVLSKMCLDRNIYSKCLRWFRWLSLVFRVASPN